MEPVSYTHLDVYKRQVLSLMKPEREKLSRETLQKTGKGIVTNPIILGIAAGLLWALLKLPQPVIMEKTVKNIAVLATPLGPVSYTHLVKS